MWTLNSGWLDKDYNMRSLALLMYGTYNAFNSIRHGGVSDANQAAHCIIQHIKQGCGGHPECTKHFDSCWDKPMNYIC